MMSNVMILEKKSNLKWSQTDFISSNSLLFLFQQVFLPQVGHRNRNLGYDDASRRHADAFRRIQRGFAPLSPVPTASDISEVPSTLSFDRAAQL